MWLRLLCCAIVMSLVGASAPAADPGIVTSHGFAVFGTLKYPAGFTHLDYTNPDAPKGGTFRSARPATYDSLNIYSLLGVPVLQLYLTYDKLMERSLDEPASQYGVLAETISYPKDLSWVEFRLRPQARFWDGRPVRPEDVIFTVNAFRTIKTVGPNYQRIGSAIAKVEKTGPRRVRMTLTQKHNPTLVAAVADLPVLPEHFYRTHDLGKSSLVPQLASGPYRVGRFSPGRWIEMVRVKDYWGADLPMRKGRMNYDVIRYDFYRDATVLAETFYAGNSDLQQEMDGSKWAYYARNPAFRRGDIKRIEIPYENGAFYAGLFLNTRRPLLRDRRAREAIVRAFDYEWVGRVLLDGLPARLTSFHDNSEFAAHGPMTPGEHAILDPFRDRLPAGLFTRPTPLPVGGDRAHQRANLIAGQRLLLSAGFHYRDMQLIDPATGRQAHLQILIGNARQERMLAGFVANLRRLGFSVAIRLVDLSQFREKQRRFDFDIAYPPLRFPPFVVPGAEMLDWWGSQAAGREGSINISGVRDPAVDAALHALVNATGRTRTVDAMRALDRVLMWDYVAIPLQHLFPARMGMMPVTYWDKFGRPPREPTYNWPSSTLEHWWIDPAKEARIREHLGQRG